MSVITPQRLNDLVATTNRRYGRPNFTQIATDLQEYTWFKELIMSTQAEDEMEGDGGTGFQWDVMVEHNGSAQNQGIGAPDNVVITDTMTQAQADWRGSTANYGMFAEEVSMNRGAARIVDLIRARQIACMISIAELIENNGWGPPVALTDEVTPWGVNTWLVKNATEGFNGGAPSGWTTIGLNPTTYPNWKNYTFQYVTMDDNDGLDKWRRAARKTKFKPPVENPDFNTGNRYGFYVNETTISTLELYLKGSNDNLGMDLAKYMNEVTFMRTPVKWVPKLDADTTNPVYGVNWGELKTKVLKGWWLRETYIPHYPGQHTLGVYFKDCRYNHVARNRRSHFVGATGTSYPS